MPPVTSSPFAWKTCPEPSAPYTDFWHYQYPWGQILADPHKNAGFLPLLSCRLLGMVPIPSKTDGSARLQRHRHLVCMALSEKLRNSPVQVIQKGRENLSRWRGQASPRRRNEFWDQWGQMLETWSVGQIIALLQSQGEKQEQLRISNPFAGVLTEEELRHISHST